MNRYAIANEGDAEVLIGSIGFMGPPADGQVEIGYAVLPEFQDQGYATEMVAGLAHWALGQVGVDRVLTETGPDNAASLRVLAKARFVASGQGREPELLRLELRRPVPAEQVDDATSS